MLFVISVVFSVIGFFLAFFGITYENFTNHPTLVKALKWGMGVSLAISVVAAFFENEGDEKEKIQQARTIGYEYN